MSGNWLDLSKNSNLFIQSYVQGFVDISGGNLLLRNNNLLIAGGDASLNGRVYVTGDVSVNSRLFISGDTSLNGRLFVRGDTSFNGNLKASLIYIGGELVLPTSITSDGYNNTRLGTNAIQGTTTGSNNIGAGYNSGITNITGSNNTFLGANTNISTTSTTQSTAVGYNSQITANNQIVLGTTTEKNIFMGDVSINGNLLAGSDLSFIGNLTAIGNVTISTGTKLSIKGATVGIGGGSISSTTSNVQSTDTTTYGQNWTMLSSVPGLSTSAAYTSVAVSSTGQYIVACTNQGSVYESNNYGGSFISNISGLLTTGQYSSVSISSTGQYQATTVNGGSTYLSTNYGSTFAIISIAGITSAAFSEVAISSTGQYQIVTSSPGSIYVSNNYGTSFIQNRSGASTTASYTSTSISSGGQYMLASVNPGALYISSDYGLSFAPLSALSTANFTSASVSSTGQYMITCINNGLTYISSNYGETLIARPVVTTTAAYQWTSISSTGQYMMVSTNTSIYLSSNYGQTFIARASTSGNYQTSAISSTGKYMIAAANPGAVYLSSPPLVSTITTNLSGMATMTDLSMNGNLYTPTIVTSQVKQVPLVTLPNFGVTWQNSAANPRTGLLAAINLYGTAISGTGQYQLISWDIETMYLSSDYGTTWTKLRINGTTNYVVSLVAMSETGQYMIGLNGTTTYYFSNDYGTTFIAKTSPVGFNRNLAMSSTGQYIVACVYGGALYLSSNYGSSWTANPGTGLPATSTWNACAGISTSGQYILAGGGNVPTYLSSNYGVSWSICSNILPTASNTRAGSVSSSGQYMLTAYEGGNIYVSSNYGITWSARYLTAPYWSSGQSISSSGQYMVVGQYVGPISYSNNYGRTWKSTAITNISSLSVAVSSNGQYTLIGQNNSSLYWSVSNLTQSLDNYLFTNIKGYVGFTDASGSSTGADAKALVEINGVGNLTKTYQNTTYIDNYSLYTSGSVLIGQNLNVASDRRIKTNIQDVVDVSALSVMRQLKPKQYTYIDTKNRGVQPVWGYIAQEVKAVVDYAVNEVTDYVPNIYYNVTINGNMLTLPAKTYMIPQYDESGNPIPEIEYTDPMIPTTANFTPNQDATPIQIKLIHIESGKVITTTIIDIQDEQTIIVADDLSQYQTLFLYGQKVTDFNVLDKNAVFTIATAALQEVDLELQEAKAQVQELANDLALIRIRGTYGSP